MPRLPRYILPGQPQHIIQRGNNRCAIFAANADYSRFRLYLEQACIRYQCLVHAYVFMTNHVHLLVTPEQLDSISKVLQSVGRRYVQYFNNKYRRSGTLWEGRYKATLVDTERYLLLCYRYVELNPVRANIVLCPDEYRWSSYRANALGEYDALVTPHEQYMALGRLSKDRQDAYRALFSYHLDNRSLEGIRQATQRSWALGSEQFKDAMEVLLGRRTRPLVRGGDRRSRQFRKGKVGFN